MNRAQLIALSTVAALAIYNCSGDGEAAIQGGPAAITEPSLFPVAGDLAGLMASAEAAKAMEELQARAEELTFTDPRGAMSALEKLATISAEQTGYLRQARETQITALQGVLEHYRTADRLLDLGQALFTTGRPREAELAFCEVQELDDVTEQDSFEALVWQGACARVLGRTNESTELAALAQEQLAARAEAERARQAAATQERQALDYLPWTTGQGSYSGYGQGPVEPGSMLGLRSAAELEAAFPDIYRFETQTAGDGYHEAKAAYEADYDRWRTQADYMARQSARLGAMGLEVISDGVRGPDPSLQSAYEAAARARGRY